jgi:hypothetical protein
MGSLEAGAILAPALMQAQTSLHGAQTQYAAGAATGPILRDFAPALPIGRAEVGATFAVAHQFSETNYSCCLQYKHQ